MSEIYYVAIKVINLFEIFFYTLKLINSFHDYKI